MLSIQELGLQILNHNPQKFYVFGGSEYGIKCRYIEELKTYYNGNIEEHNSVMDLLSMMNTKHIIPISPKVYVVRYDEVFYSQLSEKVANKIKRSNILGTIVCVYEQQKHINKMDKYLPEYTCTIDQVSEQFILKYLHNDFPDMSDKLIKNAIKSSDNYSQAKSICSCMQFEQEYLNTLPDETIQQLFGHEDVSTQSQIRKGVAARNFNYLLNLVSNFDGQLDSIIYTVLQTMIDMDKLKDSTYGDSDIKEYVNKWTREDIYYMFMHAYDQLVQLRSLSSYDIENSLTYLFSLLQFSRIPSLEEMR